MCLTLALKSGGSVLAPVRRFTRKAFQLEYLCCMPVRRITKNCNNYHQPTQNTGIQVKDWTSLAQDSLFGGTRGLPLEAHHPTGCTSGIQRLHQKSLLVSLSKPSYRRRALNPVQRYKTQLISQLILDLGNGSCQNNLQSRSTYLLVLDFQPYHMVCITWMRSPKSGQNNKCKHLQFHENSANSICWWGPGDTVETSKQVDLVWRLTFLC